MFNPDRHIIPRLPVGFIPVEAFVAGDGGTTDATSIGFYIAGFMGDAFGMAARQYILIRCGNWYYDGGQMAMSDQAKKIVGEFLPYMRKRYQITESAIFIDPACKALRLEIEKLGLQTQGADNNGHDIKGSSKGLKVGVEMLQSGIQNDRFFIVEDPVYGAEPFLKEVGLYCTDAKGEPIDAYNHAMDETRYAYNYFAKQYGLWG